MSIVTKRLCFRIPLGTEVGLSLGNIVLDGDPAHLPQNGESRQFSANVRCGQTAGWIMMPLGMEVNLGPVDVVLDGIAAPLNGTQPPVLGSCLLWPNGWMDEDATWYGCPHVHRRSGSLSTPNFVKNISSYG